MSVMERLRDKLQNTQEYLSISLDCKMCKCHHKVHWSAVAMVVNLISIVMYTTGVATHYWAVKSEPNYFIHTGLFMACNDLNNTCYDTHYQFDMFPYEKGIIVASAILSVFATIGFYLFFALSVFFLCGLYSEKSLATGAVVTSFVSGLFALIGVVMFSVAVQRLSYSLSWSFILVIIGFIVNFAAGILMCIGRNISTESAKKKSKKTRKRGQVRGRENRAAEEMQMEETNTTRKNIWSAADGLEIDPPAYSLKKKPLPGATGTS